MIKPTGSPRDSVLLVGKPQEKPPTHTDTEERKQRNKRKKKRSAGKGRGGGEESRWEKGEEEAAGEA